MFEGERKAGNGVRATRGAGQRHRWAAVLAAGCLLASAALFGHAGWMQAKAWLAQQLIAQAWSQTLAGESRVKPWPWADTWPVARLTTPAGDRLYVLAGMTGHALAFGPARMAASHPPGRAGSTVIAGHKDSHFRFLEGVERGQRLRVQTPAGRVYDYRVEAVRVADSRAERLVLDHSADELMLITCYPFGAGDYDSPLRYVVRAVRA